MEYTIKTDNGKELEFFGNDKYVVICGDSVWDTAYQVKQLILQGWTPLGSPFVDQWPNGICFQAMFKK